MDAATVECIPRRESEQFGLAEEAPAPAVESPYSKIPGSEQWDGRLTVLLFDFALTRKIIMFSFDYAR